MSPSAPAIASRRVDSPLGPLLLAASASAIVRCAFDAPAERRPHDPSPLLDRFKRELDDYFAGCLARFSTPLDPAGTPFERSAWAALERIPPGQTRTYGGLARTLGNPAASRAVGRSCGRNPIVIAIPCHRVLASDGSLHGFGGGLERKRWLLEHEGAQPGVLFHVAEAEAHAT